MPASWPNRQHRTGVGPVAPVCASPGFRNRSVIWAADVSVLGSRHRYEDEARSPPAHRANCLVLPMNLPGKTSHYCWAGGVSARPLWSGTPGSSEGGARLALPGRQPRCRAGGNRAPQADAPTTPSDGITAVDAPLRAPINTVRVGVAVLSPGRASSGSARGFNPGSRGRASGLDRSSKQAHCGPRKPRLPPAT